MGEEDRLLRIETKLDKLVDAMVTMSHLHGSVERNCARLTILEKSIHTIELKMPLIDLLGGTVTKIIIGVLTVAVLAVLSAFFTVNP